MLAEIRSLVSTNAAVNSAAAATAPAAAASALFSHLASEHRRRSIEDGGAFDAAGWMSTGEGGTGTSGENVESRLRAEQEVEVAAIATAAMAQKKNLETQLDQAGATVEEKEVRYFERGG